MMEYILTLFFLHASLAPVTVTSPERYLTHEACVAAFFALVEDLKQHGLVFEGLSIGYTCRQETST